jgi:hypothetical protein
LTPQRFRDRIERGKGEKPADLPVVQSASSVDQRHIENSIRTG